MKRILSIVSIAAVVTACNPEPKVAEMTTAAPTLDTVGLAQFQQWKVENELQRQSEIQEQPTQVSYAAAAPVARKKTYTAARRTSSSRSVSNQGSGTISSETANTAKARKRISKAAKGTAIGAASGAVIGAVVNKKNRVVGGVIGGVLGGGIGYGIGRGMDKKDGRY